MPRVQGRVSIGVEFIENYPDAIIINQTMVLSIRSTPAIYLGIMMKLKIICQSQQCNPLVIKAIIQKVLSELRELKTSTHGLRDSQLSVSSVRVGSHNPKALSYRYRITKLKRFESNCRRRYSFSFERCLSISVSHEGSWLRLSGLRSALTSTLSGGEVTS